MAEFTTGEEAAAKKASRSFRKYQYRGVELDQLLDMNNEAFIELRKSKREAAANEKPAMVKTHLRDMIIMPEMIGSVVGVYVSGVSLRRLASRFCQAIMAGHSGFFGRKSYDARIYWLKPLHQQNGKSFTTVEIKPEMTGHYLGEFSITYKPVGHGRGANMKDSRFMPLK
ncbi:MAG: ribosomal protein S15 [Tremellales sp. Tagirdzhanova-0007]|nr:MAG: ribosomal protein S15 [Tremellales sp. Tagirdzhanova-0007]